MNVVEMLSHKGTEVATIPADRTVADALQLLSDWNIGALVVSGDGRRIEGMISERDIVRHLAGGDAPTLTDPVAAVMSRDVQTCRPLDLADVIMAQMTELRLRHLPVVDDHGQLCGVISIGDVVKSRVAELETEQAMLVDYVQGGR